MFVTFYSYKGGVGRSMALANIACLLAEDEIHPQRVLLWDFDLEAPALHRLFPPQEPRRYGLVDLAYEFATTGECPEVSDYIYQSSVTGVDVLPAGFVGESYCDRLQQIDWVQFFASSPIDDGPFFSPLLKALSEKQYDYVLIDSRTGLHDQAGICTQLLPDILVILFRLTDQNLDGLEHVVPAIRAQQKLRGKERILTLPIASGVSTNASEEVRKNRDRALRVFQIDKLDYIRFDYDLASDERLFCLKSKRGTMWPLPSIVADYDELSSAIRARNENDTRTALDRLDDKLRRGDSASAAAMLRPLLIRRPRLGRLWTALYRLSEQGALRAQEADALVEKILEADKENSFAYEWRARRYLEMAESPDCGEVTKARTLLRKALDSSPDRTGLHRLMARAASVQGNVEEAGRALRNARELAPENAQVVLDLAMLYVRRGANYFPVAIEALEELPEDVEEKWVLEAYLRAFLGDHEGARVAFGRYEEREEHEQRRQLHRAHLRLIEGGLQEAKDLAEAAVRSSENPPSNTDQVNWAEFFLCAQDFERARGLLADPVLQGGQRYERRAFDRLAVYLGGREREASASRVVEAWHRVEHWNLRELLLFRERSKRDGAIEMAERLDVLEQIIRQDELQHLSQWSFGRVFRLRRRRARRGVAVRASVSPPR